MGSSVWLHDCDAQENYKEVEAQEPQPEPEE
jgi:hypothetical protein